MLHTVFTFPHSCLITIESIHIEDSVFREDLPKSTHAVLHKPMPDRTSRYATISLAKVIINPRIIYSN